MKGLMCGQLGRGRGLAGKGAGPGREGHWPICRTSPDYCLFSITNSSS